MENKKFFRIKTDGAQSFAFSSEAIQGLGVVFDEELKSYALICISNGDEIVIRRGNMSECYSTLNKILHQLKCDVIDV